MLLLFQLVWIGVVLWRLPRDIREFLYPENKLDRLVLIFFWCVTILFIRSAAIQLRQIGMLLQNCLA